VGGKAQSLSVMIRAGIDVPPGFVITSEVFTTLLGEAGLSTKIEQMLVGLDYTNIATLEKVSRNIRGDIEHLALPTVLQKEILNAFNGLATTFVAVRSSATAEDGKEHAWAGQLESHLMVDKDNLLESIKCCWSSLFTPRALFYRFEQGLESAPVGVAVIVQQMIMSEVSGVAFSVHPVTGDAHQIVIEAGSGLGEAVVSGSLTPDQYIIEKNSLQLIYSSQTSKVQHKLTNEQLLTLSRSVLAIEDIYAFPCDIEWAYVKDHLYILQCRPITTLHSVHNKDAVQKVCAQAHTYDRLGRWLAPVLESGTWLDWSKTIDARRFVTVTDDPDTVVIDGHYLLSQQGAYRVLRDIFIKEYYTRHTHSSSNIINLAETISRQCMRRVARHCLGVSYKDVVKTYGLLQRLRFPWMICSSIGDAGEQYLASEALREGLDFKELKEYIPHIPTILDHDRKYLNVLKRYIQDKKLSFSFKDMLRDDPVFAQTLSLYQKKTEYLGTYHFRGKGRTMARFMKALQDSKEVYRVHSKIKDPKCALFFKKHTKIFALIAKAVQWRTDCAQISANLSYTLRPFLRQLAQKYGLTYEEIIYLELSEIEKLHTSGGIFLPIIHSRQRGFGMFSVQGKTHISTGDEYALLKKSFGMGNVRYVGEEIKGLVGNKGFIQGAVAIVCEPKDQMKVKPGMVMVSPETTPNFLPAMALAAAFITDQGGITSHAAIVAREMNKPCVIGTQIASQVLCDGDKVEVDAFTGIVRILLKKKRRTRRVRR